MRAWWVPNRGVIACRAVVGDGLAPMLHCSSLQASFVGAMAIADLVKSTLGPKGMVRNGA